MGVDTKCALLGRVEPEAIAAFLEELTGEPVKHSSSVSLTEIDSEGAVFLGDKGVMKVKSGWIDLTYNGQNRTIMYYYSDCFFPTPSEIKSYIEDGLIELAGETTRLSLGHNLEAIEIMNHISMHFGGYVDENDCDDTPYQKVEPVQKKYALVESQNGDITVELYNNFETAVDKAYLYFEHFKHYNDVTKDSFERLENSVHGWIRNHNDTYDIVVHEVQYSDSI